MSDIPPIVTDPLRLAILDSYNILDTLPEQGFDDVVLLAREICQTPVALVSFVGSRRHGLRQPQGPSSAKLPLSNPYAPMHWRSPVRL
jgi:hypothetical protein